MAESRVLLKQDSIQIKTQRPLHHAVWILAAVWSDEKSQAPVHLYNFQLQDELFGFLSYIQKEAATISCKQHHLG